MQPDTAPATVIPHPVLAELVERRALRRKVEKVVDFLVAVLDELGGDPDIEETGDDEPTLGWPIGKAATGQPVSNVGSVLDLELDTADHEPCLGAPERHPIASRGAGHFYDRSRDQSQVHWDQGSQDGRELEDEHGTDIDRGEAGDDDGIADIEGAAEQGFDWYPGGGYVE